MRPIQAALALRIKGDKTGENLTYTAKDLQTHQLLYEVRTLFDCSPVQVLDGNQKLLMVATRSEAGVFRVADAAGQPLFTVRKVHKVHGMFEIYNGDVKIHHITHHVEPKGPPALTLLQLNQKRPPEGEIKDVHNQVIATFKEGTHEEHEKHHHGIHYTEPR
eukprot:EG_transcript_38043